MADKQYQDDLSMDDYFENGTVRDADGGSAAIPPTTTNKKSRMPSGKRKKKAERGKLILMIVVGVLVLVLIIWLIVSISKRRNDGAKYALKYSQCIGASMSDAMSNVKLSLHSESDYSVLNNAFQPFSNCATSKKKTEVQGVTLPQWMILCNTTESNLSDVWFYDYRVLEDNPYGTKRKAYLDPSQVSTGEEFEKELDLKPYCIHYLPDHTEVREYRYCFEDAETGDLTAYIISAQLNAGVVTTVTDRRVDFLSAIIKSSLN